MLDGEIKNEDLLKIANSLKYEMGADKLLSALMNEMRPEELKTYLAIISDYYYMGMFESADMLED